MDQKLPQGPSFFRNKKLPLSRGTLLFLLLVTLVSLSTTVYILTSKKKLEPPSKAAGVPAKEPTVALKTEYTNPFSPSAQFVNPFDYYKSPLFSLKK